MGKYIFIPLAANNEIFGFPRGSYLGLWSPTRQDIPEDQLYSQKSIDETIAALKESTVTVQYMIIAYSVVAFIISLIKIFCYRKKEVNSLVLNSSTIVVVIGCITGVPLILASIGGLLQALITASASPCPWSLGLWW